jgi:hypothetical protein
MSDVTIDTLAVEITSNSAGAAKGIDELAASLMKLKGTTISSTAVKNLTDLTGALRGLGSVTSEAQKIGNLADSIKKLSSVGSMNKIINQLNKLPGAVKGLSSITIDQSLTEKVNGLTSALHPLTTIKPGGLGTMVNALAKIGTVTKSLDDDTIGKFADRVKKLNDTLGPLSTKMTTVQAGLRGVNSAAKTAGSGVKELGTKINATALNLASIITVLRGVVSALMPLVRLFSDAIGQAMEWDGISYQFGNAFGEQADEYYEQITRITEALNINKQTFMENSSLAASMLKGFGVGSEDARKMGVGYTELAYDIWAAYNNIYKTLDGADGAMAAIRSAIAGEVEPIRRAGFTIVESQLEITAANHGIAYSSEKATEAQKSYLRYLTLVEQAHAKGIVGAYAHELNTAEGLTRTLTQQLKGLAQAFGSLFLPILVKVMPWLQAFVDLLTEAIYWVANFFGIEIQPATWGDAGFGGIVEGAEETTDALEDTADAVDKTTNALKDLKKATIGIDELNVISPPTANKGSGGSGGSGDIDGIGGTGWDGLDIESLWDQAIFDNIKSQVNDIKQRIKDFFDEWKTEIMVIGGLLGALSMAKMLEHLGQALGLGDKFLKTMETIAKLAVTGIVIVLQYTLMAEFLDKFIDGEGFKNYIAALFVGAIGTGILYSMWGPAGLVIGLGVTAAASLKAVIDNGGITSTESALVALTGFAAAVGSVATAWHLMKPVIEVIKEYVEAVKFMAPEVGLLNAMFPKLSGSLASIGTAISGAWQAVVGFLGAISAPVWAAIVAAIVALIGTIVFLKENWDEVKAAAKRFFDENIGPKIDSIKESFRRMGEALGPVGDAIAGAWKWLKELVSKINLMDGVKAVFEGIGFVVVEVFGGLIAGTFQAVMGIIDGFVRVVSGVVEVVSGVFKAIYKVITGDLSGAWDAVKQMGQGIVDVFVGLYRMTIGPVIDFVEGIIDWCVYLWDELVGHSIIPDTIDGIVECFKGLPGKAIGFVVNFVSGIIDKFKDFGSKILGKIKSGWDTVKSWWKGKSGLEKAEVAVSLVKKGWTSVKKWIGSIPAVSQAVKLAKSGWSTVKGWIGKMPTLSAGIKLVKSGWTSVKKWLGSLDFKLNFKLPKIGVEWGSKTFAGFKISYPKGFYTYAKGGFPDMGELFVAREAGPEMVGKIGNKTTVANNQQIVEAVSEGVYAAVLAAMRQSESNGTQAVNVYLDSRQITSSVEKRQRERGASIMGRQVYAY